MKYAALFLLALTTCAAPVPAQTPPNMEAKPYDLQELVPVVKDGIPAIVYYNGETYSKGVVFMYSVQVEGVGKVRVQLRRTINSNPFGDIGDTATVVDVPDGWRAEPPDLLVPEGGRGIIYLLPDGLS